MLRAKNIVWDVDMEDVYDMLDEMKPEEAAERLDIPADTYGRMTTEERHDYAYDALRRSPSRLNEIVGLPDSVDIPEDFTDEEDEDIAEWLTEMYEFCINSYDIVEV